MEALSDLLERVFSPTQQRKLRVQQALRRWAEIVGAEVARATRVDSLRGDTLFVATPTAVWTQELTLLKPQILEKLRGAIGEEVIRDIVFRPEGRLARRSKKRKGAGQNTSNEPIPTAPPKLTRSEQEWLESLATGIEDSQLQAALRQCAARTLELRKLRRKKKWRECGACRHQNAPGVERCARCGRSLVLKDS